MNKKFIYLLLATIGLAGCSQNHVEVKAQELPVEAPVVAEIPTRDPDPTLSDWLLNQNTTGYTKKTTINLEKCNEHPEWFHAGCNGSQRATYYNKEESALLMGDYEGGFEHINSGYRNKDNVEEGIQHFRFDTEAEDGKYFEDMIDDWSFAGQRVGIYYPTLTSLSALIDQEKDWSYDSSLKTFSYLKSDSTLLQKFQYFAAPMLLDGTVTWSDLKIKLDEGVLTIMMFDDAHTPITTAEITPGY